MLNSPYHIVSYYLLTDDVQAQAKHDDQTAVGQLLDIVSRDLEKNDESTYNQLVYSLVRTDQPHCARLLDQQLTEKYQQDTTDDSKHGQ